MFDDETTTPVESTEETETTETTESAPEVANAEAEATA